MKKVKNYRKIWIPPFPGKGGMAEWCIPLLSATFRLFQDPASIHLIVLSLNVICDLLTSYGFNIDFDEKSLGHTQTDRHSYSYICINVFWSIPSRLEAAGIVKVVWFPNPASLTAANSSSASCRGRHIIFSRCETDSSVASPLYVSRYDSNIPLPPPWTLNV